MASVLAPVRALRQHTYCKRLRYFSVFYVYSENTRYQCIDTNNTPEDVGRHIAAQFVLACYMCSRAGSGSAYAYIVPMCRY